ncbi:Uncharacterised protein [uncultured archaeon]|nr:Uncharacterised protein [uncultured archaeon]
MDERTITISSADLVDHTILARKKNELEFKKDFLLRAGGKDGDLHLKAIDDELATVAGKLAPIDEKLSIADMITVVPNRKEIGAFTSQINQYSRVELDNAVKNKGGQAYELMKKRAMFVKNNFERREDVARLTILLNSLPRKDAETLRALIEEGSGEDVDVSFIARERQQELVNLSARLGRDCCVFAGSFSIDKKKADKSEIKPVPVVARVVAGRQIWVDAAKSAEFDSNEKALSTLLAKLQAKNAEKQARSFTTEEMSGLEKMEAEYLAAKDTRQKLSSDSALMQKVEVKKKGAMNS